MLRSRLPLLLVLLAGGALALTAGRAWAGAGRWTSFGPGGGYVEQILLEPAPDPALDPAGGDALYAVTAGGAFRSANAGVTWRGCGREPFDPLELSTPFLFLAPNLPGTLLATRRGAIYRSTDFCLHWTLLSQEGALLAVLAGDVPEGPPVLLTQGGGSLLRSRDGGSTWDELTIDARPEDGFFGMLAADPGSPKTLYAMLRNPETELKTIYRSDDGGDAWRLLGAVPGPVPPGEQVCLTVAPSRPGIVYAVVGTIVYRSGDAGVTWTQKGQTFANCVEVSPLSPDVLWSVGFDSLSGSQDGGRTWSELDAGLPAPYEMFSTYKVLSAAADPRRPGVLWAGTRGSGVRRSTDGGRTWHRPGLQRGLTNLPVTGLLLDPWDPARFYITLVGSRDATTAPPVLRSRDGGATWNGFARELSTDVDPLAWLAFDRHNPRSLWAVGGSTLFHSANRGQTWATIGSIPQTDRLTVLDADTLFLDGSGVLRSTDGGLTWDVVLSASVSPDDPSLQRTSLELLVDPRQPAILYDRAVVANSIVQYQRVYKSRDGGATWHRLINNSNVLAVDPKRAGRLFSVKNGAVLMSLDRGATWRRVGALGGEIHALRMDLHAADVLYAATDQGLWWSRDAGATWQAVPAGLAPLGRNNLVDIVVDPFRPLYLYGLPAGGGIYEIDLRPSGGSLDMVETNRPARVAVILAAGKGTRMRSELPKVLHEAAGRPLLAWVVDAARAAGCARILIVVGHGAEQVRESVTGDDLGWVVQAEQRGTGHALAQAEGEIPGAATILVLSGDVPLVTPATLEQLAAAAEAGWGAMAVADLDAPGSLGRVLTRSDGGLDRIVEARDASPEELAVRRINSGLYALPAPDIFGYLSRVTPNNAQGELYLTDAVSDAAKEGRPVRLVPLADPAEALGINNRAELAAVHRLLIDRHLRALMDSGVTILEPARTVVEPGVRVGVDTVIHPGVSLLGQTEVGAGCVLHQGAWLRDTRVATGVTIHPYSVLDGAEVGDGCQVGPFARLRPAARLAAGARVGNFVEVKNAELAAGSKVNHLAYVGDASVGEGANVGAGVVTCNYDGVRKNRTEIGRRAFIGSDTMLVAPVRVGDDASTAAGSVITKNVPDGALAVGRVRQKNLAGRAGGLRRHRDETPEEG